MKRYLLFWGDDYYPKPGWLDFKYSSNDVDELKEIAIKRFAKKEYRWQRIDGAVTSFIDETRIPDWAQIVDLEEDDIILVLGCWNKEWQSINAAGDE